MVIYKLIAIIRDCDVIIAYRYSINICDTHGLSGSVVQVASHQRTAQCAAVAHVTVPVATAVVTMAGHCPPVTGQPVT